MSQSPPSSGRFGHPALDKIIKGLAKRGAERADAAAQKRASLHPVLAQLHELSELVEFGGDARPWDDLVS